jgi:hypothetical protein
MMKKIGKNKNKRGQTMSLPFTMIFSIIMVAVIIFVAFYVIDMFLKQAEQVKLNTLPNEIQSEVTKIWSSSQAERIITLDCSSKIEEICFIDFLEPAKGADSSRYNEFKTINDEANFFYYPLMKTLKYKSFDDWQIKCGNVDCLKVSELRNPLCIPVINSRVTFTLEKEAGQAYVTVKS